MRVKEGNKEKDILEAAIRIFAENGFHQSKISQITDAANVATGSVYLYFKNKQEILEKIFEILWNELLSDFESLATNSKLTPIEKLDGMIDLLFDKFIENPSLAIVFVNEQNYLLQQGENKFSDYYTSFLDKGIDIVKSGIEQKTLWSEVDLTFFKYFILGAVRNLLHLWAHNPEKYSLNKIRHNVKYLMKHGIVE